MFELLLLTKSGREITLATAETEEQGQALAEAAVSLLGGVKTAMERGDVITANANGTLYWILPGEIEGVSLYRVPDDGVSEA